MDGKNAKGVLQLEACLDQKMKSRVAMVQSPMVIQATHPEGSSLRVRRATTTSFSFIVKPPSAWFSGSTTATATATSPAPFGSSKITFMSRDVRSSVGVIGGVENASLSSVSSVSPDPADSSPEEDADEDSEDNEGRGDVSASSSACAAGDTDVDSFFDCDPV